MRIRMWFILAIGVLLCGCPGMVSIDGMVTGDPEPEPEPEPQPEPDCDDSVPYEDAESEQYFEAELADAFISCSGCHQSGTAPEFDATNAWSIAKERIDANAASASETIIGQIMRVDGATFPAHDYAYDASDKAKTWINNHLFGVSNCDCETREITETESQDYFNGTLQDAFVACGSCHLSGTPPTFDANTAWQVAKTRIEEDAASPADTTIGKIMQIDGATYPAHDYEFPNVSDGKTWVTYHLSGIEDCGDGGIVFPVDAGAQTGEENGPCYGNGTCNENLVCVNDICSQIETGDEGGPCFGNNTCNDLLSCVNGICTDITGQEGGPCFGNGTCDSGLTCDNSLCVAEAPCDAGIIDNPEALAETKFNELGLLAEFQCGSCHVPGSGDLSNIDWGPADNDSWFAPVYALAQRSDLTDISSTSLYTHFNGINGSHPLDQTARDKTQEFLEYMRDDLAPQPCEEPCFLPYSDVDSQQYFTDNLLDSFTGSPCVTCHVNQSQGGVNYDETTAWSIAKERIEEGYTSAAATTIGQIMQVDGASYPGHSYSFGASELASTWIEYHLFGVEADPSQCTE